MIKLYVDMMSQPSRAVYIFMKKNSLPFETKKIDVAKGQNRTDEYAQVNPFQLVPAIDDNGFKLTESVAILRYLSRKPNVPDHWYPKDLQAQAKVDEYLEWQHLNTRLNCAMYTQHKFLRPRMFGIEVDQKKVADFQERMETTLEHFETIWLKDKPFLAGNEITIADLLAACELEQPTVAGYDILEGRPVLAAWYERVKDALQPHYDEGHKIVDIVRKKFGGKAPGAKL